MIRKPLPQSARPDALGTSEFEKSGPPLRLPFLQGTTLTVCPSGRPPAWLNERLLDVAEQFACVRKQGRILARWHPPGEQQAVYLKCQKRFGWVRRLAAAAWPGGCWTPALLELRNLLLAQRAGVTVAEPIGAVQVIGPRARLAGVLALRELAGQEPLHEALFRASQTLRRQDYEACLRAVLTSVSAAAARLHAARLFHRDLYLCHFFVRPEAIARPQSKPPELVLLDFHRLVRRRALTVRSAAKDLGQLLYSLREIRVPTWAEDYLLERYLQKARVTRLCGRLLRTLAKAKADRYWQHNLRRGTLWCPRHRCAA